MPSRSCAQSSCKAVMCFQLYLNRRRPSIRVLIHRLTVTRTANPPTRDLPGFTREPLNIIPGTETRGALATQVVRVTTQKVRCRLPNPMMRLVTVSRLAHFSWSNSDYFCVRKQGSVRPFLWTLQQERRPPQAGCWLVRQCLYMDNAYSETL
jgi:hypothetical protein